MLAHRRGLCLACAAVLLTGSIGAGGAVHAQPTPVTVAVINGADQKNYRVPWAADMSVLEAMEQALPAVSGVGSFSTTYFPEYGGYLVTSVGGIPSGQDQGYWSLCLLPAGLGSTNFLLPIAPNKVLVGAGDAVTLMFNQPCAPASGAHQ